VRGANKQQVSPNINIILFLDLLMKQEVVALMTDKIFTCNKNLAPE
jgi:hypothetical protein